ncbi:hypothetical protein TURU_000189 [Turdus rufiventris]|nr:hypothetical protein TURU_000189 [Turdus rufiventris]
MIGCSFVVNRKFFGEIGLLDPGMDVYGGENIELGIKLNSCSLNKLWANSLNPFLFWRSFCSDFINLVPNSYGLKVLLLLLQVLAAPSGNFGTETLFPIPAPPAGKFSFLLELSVALGFRECD